MASGRGISTYKADRKTSARNGRKSVHVEESQGNCGQITQSGNGSGMKIDHGSQVWGPGTSGLFLNGEQRLNFK